MKKFLYIISIFAMILVLESCEKEEIRCVEDQNSFVSTENAPTRSLDATVCGTGSGTCGGGIVDPDEDDDDLDEDDDRIVDPDEDDDDMDEDDDETIEERSEGGSSDQQ